MNNLFKIVKESGINLTGSIVGMGFNYLLLILLTRLLLPAEYGIFVLAQSVINVSLILVLFGMPQALDRFIPFYNIQNEQGKSKNLIFRVLKISLVLGPVVALLLFLLSDFVSSAIFSKPELSSILRIVTITIPFLAVIQIVSFVFVGYKELRYQVYIQQIAAPLSKVILAFTALIAGVSLMGWTWMYVLTVIGVSLLAISLFRRHILAALRPVAIQPFPFGRIFSYSWPMSFGGIILLFFAQIDLLILGLFRSSDEIGVYRVYVYLILTLGLVMTSFGQIYKPIVSELIAHNHVEEARETYGRVSKWIFSINILGLTTVLLFGADIVRILFTDRYLKTPTALIILAAGRFINSSFGPEGKTLEAFGRTKLWMLNASIIFAANIGLAFLLVPQYGIMGAAIAHASSIILGGLAGLIEIFILYKFQPYHLGHMKCIFAAAVSGGVIYFVKSRLPALNFWMLAVLALLLMVIYILGMFLSRSVDSVDLEIIRKIKQKIVLQKGK